MSDSETPSAQGSPAHQAAWPDMFANLQGAYAELSQAQFELERRTAEIEETRDLFQRVIESMSEALFLVDRTGHIVQANQSAGALLGRDKAALVGRPLSEVWGTTAIPATPWQLLERDRTGQLIDLDVEVHTSAGHRIVASVSTGLLRDTRGRITGVLVVARDITERNREEEARRFLAEASRVLALSLDYETTLASIARLSVPYLADACIVYMRTPAGAIRRLAIEHANPAKDGLAAQLVDEFPIDPRASEGIPKILRTGQSELHPEASAALLASDVTDPERLAALLESAHIVSWMCVPLSTRGEVVGAMSFIAEESGRRYTTHDLALAEELARRASNAIDNAMLYREAQDAIRLRDEFLSVASHELRTPLTSLQLTIQSLLLRAHNGGLASLPPERVGRILELTEVQVQRLGKLIGDLLDASRIGAGRLELELEAINLADIVRQVTARFEAELTRANCPLHVQIAPEIETIARLDRSRIDQVVTNLLSNAIKYGAGNPIEVRLEREGPHLRLIVRDHGIGIPAEHLPRIFERWERAVSARHYGGVGLGLYITRQIVEAHGGVIRATSELGQGTTFIVDLPISASAQ